MNNTKLIRFLKDEVNELNSKAPLNWDIKKSINNNIYILINNIESIPISMNE